MTMTTLEPRLAKTTRRSATPKWQIWQRMSRVLGAMAQVGLAQIGQSPPPRLDLSSTSGRKLARRG